eukprot:scaffold8762_cov138-Skeletonema_dohrnii-CCMP3373.AAC.2
MDGTCDYYHVAVFQEPTRNNHHDCAALAFNCLQRSVLSRGDCTRNYCHVLRCIARSVFLDLIAINQKWILSDVSVQILRVRPVGRTKLRVFWILIMVLIESAWKELSNGGHIVFWSKMDQYLKISAVGWILKAADGNLTPFFTELIGKKSTNQADYTSNL